MTNVDNVFSRSLAKKGKKNHGTAGGESGVKWEFC